MKSRPVILVINKDRDIHEVYKEILDEHRHHIVSAYSALDGFAMTKIFSPNLIILSMELESQEETIEKLQQTHHDVPVIAVCGKEIDRAKVENFTNIKRYFSKPLSLKNLANAVAEILQQNSQNAQNLQNSQPVIELKKERKDIEGFEFEKFIGRGGSGEVYRGRYYGEDTAVKILSNNDLSSEELRRFQREVFALATIKHENIIELLQTGITTENYYFMITKYFDGKDLETLLQEQRKLPARDAINIVIQVAKGLSVAHQENLIHRDVKPSNILYSLQEQKVKIIDFGLVKLHNLNQTITKKGVALGTPYYMSPEQCESKKVDYRSDIYNLGATFYHLLLGVPPFVKRSVVEVMMAHLNRKVIFPKDMNVDLVCVIEKMMAKKANDRYQNMEEIVKTLEQVATTL